MTSVDDNDLTIDELARRIGMTVRNIRAHQSRGLLPPPEVRGRTGYYGAEHVARIELIKELQADGFNLEAIRRLIEGANGSSTEVLRFTRALREPFAEEEAPEIVTGAELAERWKVSDPALIRKAEKLGILRPLGDGRYEETSPRLGRAATELADLGVPAETALEVGSKLRRHADGVSRAFVKLFLEEIWAPFEAAGRPEDQWPEVQDALERLRPVATEALLAVFGMAMTESVDKAFGRELEKAERGGRKRKR
ncbi:MAG TPA: MerR family transcriptional regulator [Solirubrobacterales bacterium]